jgi:hypothetical protein
MGGRSLLFASVMAVFVCLPAASCSSQSPAPARTAANPAAAAASAGGSPVARTKPKACAQSGTCTHPRVTVTPSEGLRNGQRVMVRVTGFGVYGKVFLSECATSAAANPAGCGPQLAAQPFLLTGNNRTGSGPFTVSDRASARPYSPPATRTCAGGCVIVATVGLVPSTVYAYARITFAG